MEILVVSRTVNHDTVVISEHAHKKIKEQIEHFQYLPDHMEKETEKPFPSNLALFWDLYQMADIAHNQIQLWNCDVSHNLPPHHWSTCSSDPIILTHWWSTSLNLHP